MWKGAQAACRGTLHEHPASAVDLGLSSRGPEGLLQPSLKEQAMAECPLSVSNTTIITTPWTDTSVSLQH